MLEGQTATMTTGSATKKTPSKGQGKLLLILDFRIQTWYCDDVYGCYDIVSLENSYLAYDQYPAKMCIQYIQILFKEKYTQISRVQIHPVF